MRRSGIALAAVLLTACGGTPDEGTPPPPPPAPPGLLVTGADMSGGPQNILVTRNGVAVTGATVSVNGTAMTDMGFGTYQGRITPFLDPGATVTVTVSSAGQTATGTGVLPFAAVISDPPAVTRGNPVPVSWTAAGSPDSFFVALNYTVGQTALASYVRLGGTLRTVNVPTTDIPAGATDLRLSVFGYNVGTFTGDFAAGSNMHLRTLGTDRTFTFAP